MPKIPVLLKEFGAIDYIDFSPSDPNYFAVTCSVRVSKHLVNLWFIKSFHVCVVFRYIETTEIFNFFSFSNIFVFTL